MRLRASDRFANVPVLDVRTMLRKAPDADVDLDGIRENLGISKRAAQGLLDAVIQTKMLERSEHGRWQKTVAAVAFEHANACPPLRRVTAGKLLAGLIERAAQVNREAYWLYKVERLVHFGSSLNPDEERPGDVDVAVEMTAKGTNPERNIDLSLKRAQEYAERGRYISSFMGRLWLGQRETVQFLRSRSRGLSLVDYQNEKEFLSKIPHLVIFPVESAGDSPQIKGRAPRRIKLR